MAFLQKIMTALVFVVLASQAAAAEPSAFKATIEKKLKQVSAKYQVESVEKSHIEGFYNVQLVNGPLLYVSEDGQHFFEGKLYFLDGNRMVNITQQDADRARASLMDELEPENMIVFSPKTPVKTKTHITVFTDVDCFYCQKLHQEVPELNARGIEVRYMAFPRAGIGSESYKKIVSAWCSDNPQKAITRLKNRQKIPMTDCENPVKEHYELGKRMGVNGTPAILREDGSMIPGYRPAPELAKSLGI